MGFKDKFTAFILNALKFLMAVIMLTSIGTIFKFSKELNFTLCWVFLIFAITIFLLYKIINSKMDTKMQLILISLCAFALRGLWLLNVNSFPTSDFGTIYQCAKDFLEGNTSVFRGTSYMARFPHLTIMVLYMALMIELFPIHNILIMKIVNLSLGVLSVFLIYLIAKEIFNDKNKSLSATAFASVFPPFITYTAVFCTENIAIPFYILSVYLLLRVMKQKISKYYLILSGILLAFGNLFRMVAIVIVIAYVMYLLVYGENKLTQKIQYLLLYIVPYFLIIFLVSTSLQYMKITENSLTKGSEPKIISILKGTNYENGGAWNVEDASIPEIYNYDHDKINEVSKKIIIERLTTTPPLKLVAFYIKKFALQWSEGDMSGVYWSQLYVPEDNIRFDLTNTGGMIFQLIYACIIILIFIGLFNRKGIYKNKEINLFYIIFCGYGLLHLIIEFQQRYAYIVSWVLVVLAVEGIDLIVFNIRKNKSQRKIKMMTMMSVTVFKK